GETQVAVVAKAGRGEVRARLQQRAVGNAENSSSCCCLGRCVRSLGPVLPTAEGGTDERTACRSGGRGRCRPDRSCGRRGLACARQRRGARNVWHQYLTAASTLISTARTSGSVWCCLGAPCEATSSA